MDEVEGLTSEEDDRSLFELHGQYLTEMTRRVAQWGDRRRSCSMSSTVDSEQRSKLSFNFSAAHGI